MALWRKPTIATVKLAGMRHHHSMPPPRLGARVQPRVRTYHMTGNGHNATMPGTVCWRAGKISADRRKLSHRIPGTGVRGQGSGGMNKECTALEHGSAPAYRCHNRTRRHRSTAAYLFHRQPQSQPGALASARVVTRALQPWPVPQRTPQRMTPVVMSCSCALNWNRAVWRASERAFSAVVAVLDGPFGQAPAKDVWRVRHSN
jgi:hypothetical protein